MFGIDINPFDGDGFSVGGKSASEIARGIGNFATNELLGVDDFRRAIGAARSGDYGRALKSLGAGTFELGSTLIPAGALVKGAKAGRALAGISRSGNILSRIPGFVNEAGMLTRGGRTALNAFRIAEAGQIAAPFAAGLLGSGAVPATTAGITAQPATYSNRPTGTPDTIERRQAAAAAGTPAATTTAAAPAGATTAPGKPAAVPAGGLAANDPAVQAALDAERIAAEEELQNYVNQLALARVRGSAAEEAALREAARASAGGAVDVAGMFGESGLGYSPATLMSALEQLRGQEAAARRGILGERTGRISEAGRMEESARRAYERALQGIRAREIAGRTGQTISMIQPYLGGA